MKSAYSNTHRRSVGCDARVHAHYGTVKADQDEVDHIRTMVDVVLVEECDETSPTDARPDNEVLIIVVCDVTLPPLNIGYVAEWRTKQQAFSEGRCPNA